MSISKVSVTGTFPYISTYSRKTTAKRTRKGSDQNECGYFSGIAH